MITTSKILNTTAVLSLAAVGFALITQYVFDMNPCAWCVLQRFVLLIIAVICLVSNLLPSMVKRLFAFLTALLGISGAIAAWYQHNVAAHMFSCDMSFADEFMSRTTHLDSIAPWLFGIYASCSDADVKFLGLPYSMWALLLFALIAILGFVALLRKN
ncbi:disulfide bond formation protein B [Brackiella oedipodis]|uniref:disulfide bond formation protein B n=1 Tax=Brackiella oedipodis TaxID=124225 RepID=UPI00048F1FB8|nr:disulfide bond formation protein B [Brackiella oedipodis]